MESNLANTPVFNKINRYECCGCEACANICPASCITMVEDEEGFFVPTADLSRCLKCGQCEKVCPVLHSFDHVLLNNTYAGYASDSDVVKASASGGMFSVLADAFMQTYPGEAAVCGVAWDHDFRGCHHEISADGYVTKFKTSKYVQSRKNSIYREVKNLLVKDVAVLFSGTPCEVAALYSYLGKDYPKLFTIDLVCQGPSSPKAMREYIDTLERKRNKVSNINMRYVHKTPWIPQWLKVDFEDGSKSIKLFYDTEIGAAVHIMQRKSCYECHFNGNHHYADITIGDYHGADPKGTYYNPYGTSILVVNTPKGEDIFSAINQSEVNIYRVDYNSVVRTNPRLKDSWPSNPQREEFSKTMQEKGLFEAAKNSWSLRQHIAKHVPYAVRIAALSLKRKIKER